MYLCIMINIYLSVLGLNSEQVAAGFFKFNHGSWKSWNSVQLNTFHHPKMAGQ